MSTTNILDLNNRVSALEKAVSGGDSAQANKADIATEFSVTTAYTAGCFVYYGGKLYQFNADHAAGAWDPTDVVEANVTDQVVSNKAAIDELAESYPADKVMLSDGVTSVADALGNYKVIATFTGDGIKTYDDVITAFLPYINQADLLLDAGQIFYPRNYAVYFSFNISSSGSFNVYGVRFDATNPQWKAMSIPGGTETDYINNTVANNRVIQLCKKL